MKVAITSQGPNASAAVDPRFGRARYFFVLDCVTGQQTVVDNEAGLNAAQGAGLQAVQKLANLNVQAVVTGHVGPKAWAALQTAKIPAYVAGHGTVDETAKAFLAGKLPRMDNASA